MVWRLAAAFCVLVAVWSCGSTSLNPAAAATPSPAYVPWLPLAAAGVYPQAPVPSPTPPAPIPPGTPPCQATQVEALHYGGSGASENVTTPVLFRNRGRTECVLDGYPDISIIGSGGAVLATAAGNANRGTYFDSGDQWVVPILMKTGTAPLATVLQTNEPVQGQAWINVEWFVCNHPPTASRMTIDLPAAGGRLTIPYPVRAAWNGSCVAGATSGLSRGQFTPTGLDGWPPSGVYLSDRLTIRAPKSVAVGTTLTYYVTIANTGAGDYDLDQCPDYIEMLGAKQVVAEYRLNCAPVGHIAPGESTTFQVRLALPRSLPLGANTLTWALFDGRLATENTSAPITVT